MASISPKTSTSIRDSEVSAHECLWAIKHAAKVRFSSASINATFAPTIYAITTSWAVHYPAQLEKALEAEGFHIIKPGDSLYNRTDGCDWVRYPTSYKEKSVKRGNVLYLETDTYRSGIEGDFDLIARTLRSTYPFTEITLILTFTLGIYISLIGLGLCSCCAVDTKSARQKRLEIQRFQRDQARRDEKQRNITETAVPIGFDPGKLVFRSPTTIPKDAWLLHLPAELHLELISYLHYQDCQAIRLTCRYFYYTVPEKYMDIRRWRSQLQQREGYCAQGEDIACFQCLKLKPPKDFPLHDSSRQWVEIERRKPFSSIDDSRLEYYKLVDFNRKCINCEVHGAASSDGVQPFKVNAGPKESWMCVCGACGQVLESTMLWARSHNMASGGCWCNPCFTQAQYLFDGISNCMCSQAVIALILYSVSMGGASHSP